LPHEAMGIVDFRAQKNDLGAWQIRSPS
jgi:hypothetical protein